MAPRPAAKRRSGAGGLRIGRRAYWVLTIVVTVMLVVAVRWRGHALVFNWDAPTAFQLLALLLAAFGPFVVLYTGRLRDIGRSHWWALAIPAVTLSLLFAGLNLGFSLQQTLEDWPFERTLAILKGSLALSTLTWLAATVWLGVRPSARAAAA